MTNSTRQFKVGDIVKYASGWCSEGEEKYRHVVIEVRLNPVTGEESRYLIGTLNTTLALGSTEVVDNYMIELA